MLRPQPRGKDRRRVPIPEELREALREAQYRINESQQDSTVRINYDDAIQCGCLIGGRVGTGKRPFHFTYYPQGDKQSRARWTVALHPLEIEDIVDGFATELTLYVCRSPDCMHKSTDPTHLCDCDYVEDQYWGNVQPEHTNEALQRIGLTQITTSSTREEVLAELGEPQYTGGGEPHPLFGYVHPWIKYHRPEYQVRFEFDPHERIRLIHIMDPDWEPGK